MPNETKLYRLTPSVAEILERVAERKKYSHSPTKAMVLEILVLKAAQEEGIIGEGHPEIAFWQLISMIDGWNLPAHENYTLNVFLKIENLKEAKELWENAIKPDSGKQEDKRKQAVNQRIGRFCGQKYGWDADKEIQLEKGKCEIIQSYTRLKPPSA
jgi:hypothetical protein